MDLWLEVGGVDVGEVARQMVTDGEVQNARPKCGFQPLCGGASC